MKNIVLAIDETVKSSKNWIDETVKLMNKSNGSSKGEKWTREELYRDNDGNVLKKNNNSVEND
ncbi:MAG: hypothetical protein LBT84_06930 [Spirochaetia bacterium]|jgi:hypothetical protein|nr:hypothetical protein [Spirochaetia bacterium]